MNVPRKVSWDSELYTNLFIKHTGNEEKDIFQVKVRGCASRKVKSSFSGLILSLFVMLLLLYVIYGWLIQNTLGRGNGEKQQT